MSEFKKEQLHLGISWRLSQPLGLLSRSLLVLPRAPGKRGLMDQGARAVTFLATGLWPTPWVGLLCRHGIAEAVSVQGGPIVFHRRWPQHHPQLLKKPVHSSGGRVG